MHHALYEHRPVLYSDPNVPNPWFLLSPRPFRSSLQKHLSYVNDQASQFLLFLQYLESISVEASSAQDDESETGAACANDTMWEMPVQYIHRMLNPDILHESMLPCMHDFKHAMPVLETHTSAGNHINVLTRAAALKVLPSLIDKNVYTSIWLTVSGRGSPFGLDTCHGVPHPA